MKRTESGSGQRAQESYCDKRLFRNWLCSCDCVLDGCQDENTLYKQLNRFAVLETQCTLFTTTLK